MTVGSRSVLSGVHRIFIHPVVTAVAWWRLYGFPRDVRLWAAFILSDVGYIGRFPSRSGRRGPCGVRRSHHG